MINRIKIPVVALLFFATTYTNPSFSQTNASDELAEAKAPEITINIFPNPNRGNFYITLVNCKAQEGQLFTLDGRFVKSLYLSNGLNYIDIQGIPAGIYFLEMGEGENKENYKITVK